MPAPDTDVLYGWILALCNHTVLRRAAEDAHAAIMNPHEALVYVYRGLEWLVEGMDYSWETSRKNWAEPRTTSVN
jgi:hypothetical protein